MQTRSKYVKSSIIGLVAGLTACQAHAEPQIYQLDGSHTHIVWQVERFGFTNTVGTFTAITAELSLDKEEPENSSVRAEIALSGLRSDLIEREDIIRGPYWLNADKFPTITFKSESVNLIKTETCPSQCAHVKGMMSLKGVQAPLVLEVVLNKIGTDPVTKKQAMGFRATGRFQRGDFGVSTALGPVGNDVSFQIEALAIAMD